MAALKLADVRDKKKASGGPYKGLNYQDIVRSKIKDKKPFIVGAKNNTNIVYGVSFQQQGTQFVLSYATSKTAKKPTGSKPITQFFKDEDFGGGKGSGGGAQDTTWTESLQCYYLSLLYNSPLSTLTNANTSLKDLTKQGTYCFTYDKTKKITAKDCFNNCPEDWFEKEIFIKTANAIYKSDYGAKFKGKTVYFHRGSPFMNAVYNNKKQAFDHDKKVAKTDNTATIAPGSFSDDKWNPGDIWMSTLDPLTKEPFVSKKGIVPVEWTTLRESVFSQKTTTLGISLKKVEGSTAKITPFNLPKRKHNKKVRYLGYQFGQTGDFFNSADMYLHFSDGIMQLRATQTIKSWQGEMKGAAAAMGKIGGGNVNFYTEDIFKKSIGYSVVKSEWSEIKYNSGALNKFYGLYKRFLNFQYNTEEQTVLSKSEFKKRASNYRNPKGGKSGPAFYFGKYMCLLMLETINADGQSTKLHEFATSVIRYAMSNTDISTFYIKVS
jgi:hypothetical protein|tara:strand:- start:49 stop:1527 length:1479 start_codon:yes stop_codon:yes gene_type:complete